MSVPDEIRVYVLQEPDRTFLTMRYVDPITGKQVKRSTGTTDRKDALRAAGAWQAELREGRYYAPNKITWDDFRGRYEREVLPGLAEKTRRKVSAVFNVFEEILKPARLRDVNEQRLSYYVVKLRERQAAEDTIKGSLGHVRAALRWANRIGLLAKVPKFDMPKRAKGSKVMKGRPITLEEFERMLAAIPRVISGDWKKARSDDKPPNRLPKRRPKPRTPEQQGQDSRRCGFLGALLEGALGVRTPPG